MNYLAVYKILILGMFLQTEAQAQQFNKQRKIPVNSELGKFIHGDSLISFVDSEQMLIQHMLRYPSTDRPTLVFLVYNKHGQFRDKQVYSRSSLISIIQSVKLNKGFFYMVLLEKNIFILAK
jgi:hypothetical protein